MFSLNNKDVNNINTYIFNNVSFAAIDTAYLLTRIMKGNRYSALFDGRLHNSKEIKEDLLKLGHTFLTNTDVELALLSYITYGNDFITKLDGVFSLAIYDFANESLFVTRDRLGIKPLYYAVSNDFVFGTKIKSILSHPSITAKLGQDELCELFGLGPAHSPGKTFFKGIYEIIPGYYGIYANHEFKMYKYWDLETTNMQDNIEQSIDKTRCLVTSSLKRELPTDKPVCSMLSGGLDSSVLSMLASKEKNNLTTFSIDFEGNESNFTGTDYQPTRDSDFVVVMREFLKTNHINLYFSTEEIFESLKDAMLAREMPGMADVDSSLLVFCKKIKECGFDTVISGECSDEIFGGYPWYYKEHLVNSSTFPWSRSIDTRKNIINPNLVSTAYLEEYVENAFQFTSNNVVYNNDDEMENKFRKTCYNTIKWFMNTLVERSVRISDITGLDIRVPFADYKIFEYIYNVSAKHKLGLINGNNTPIEKYLLRKAFEDELPHNVVYRKKSPFPKTYDPKYTKLLEDNIKNIINSSTAPILEIINVAYLYEILETKGDNLKENWFGQLMTYPQLLAYLIQINMWLEEYNVEIDI